MYKFVDTTEIPKNKALPTEALQLNGEYLENLIEGYRTLTVQGREALSSEVATEAAGLRPGSVYVSRKYPERIITVKYQLSCKSAEAFREAYNQLATILDVEEARLIFADEPDKYFTGTPGMLEDVEPGKNTVVSTIQFVCSDPFKYSVAEYEAELLNDGTLYCDYHGTFPAHPTLSAQFLVEGETTEEGEASTITGTGDCGYVAFFDSDEHILQFGDPDEADGEDLSPTQTLVASHLTKSTSWTNTVRNIWPTNSANGVVTTGATKSGTAGMISSVLSGSSVYYTGATAYGSGTSWHGPCISAAIPADAAGDVGADNYSFEYQLKFACSNQTNGNKGYGEISCYLSDDDGYKLLGVRIRKIKEGTKGQIIFIVRNTVKNTFNIDVSTYNKFFGNNRNAYYKKVGKKKVLVPAIRTNKTVKITKNGSKVVMSAGGITRTYYLGSALNAVKRITFHFKAYSTKTTMPYMGIYQWKFNKMYCGTYKDVPNKFTASDLLEVNTADGEVLMNGDPTPSLGALGNDWEEFLLQPGENQIGWACSDWCEDPPTVGMKYREVYL